MLYIIYFLRLVFDLLHVADAFWFCFRMWIWCSLNNM